MSEELLRLDKLPTLGDLRFLVREVLSTHRDIGWDSITTACRSFSVTLAFSFANGIKLLDELSFVTKQDDGSFRLRLSREQKEQVKDDLTFCTLITRRLMDQLEQIVRLTALFNPDIVKFDAVKDSYSLNIHHMPLDYPVIKSYLLNMGIAYTDKDILSRLLIRKDYKGFFVEEILSRALPGSVLLDLYQKEGNVKTIPEQEPPAKVSVSVFILFLSLTLTT